MRDVSRYHIGLKGAHTILAQACLGVLLQLDDRVNRDNIEGFPLALYSAQYWATHARFGNVSPRIKDWMECLFDEDKPHFARWLWMDDDEWGPPSLFTMLPEKPEAVPLYHATRLGLRDLAEHLVAEHPEHINARSKNGLAPIHVAARKGHVDVLALLLEHGAYVDSRSVYNQTPLSWAAVEGEVDAGQYLLDCGADIDVRNDFHATPLYLAARNGHIGFVRLLLERRPMIDARDDRGRTPLHQAVEWGKIQTARLLLEHGADVDVRDDSGMTPRVMAMTTRQRFDDSGMALSHAQFITMRQEFVELFSMYAAESLK
jgi:hypothetical protein